MQTRPMTAKQHNAPQIGESELALRPEQTLAVANQIPPFDIEAIFRLAIEKEGTAETIEKLMGIRRELNAEAAKKAFNESLALFQQECPIIKKGKFGAKNAYKYAPLDSIISQVQPLLTKYGFSFTVTSDVEKDWVKAICKVTHRAGHSESSEFKIPTDARNTMMNDPQRYAGSLTFAKRYAFCNSLGILTGDEDKDGAGDTKASASGRVVTPELRFRFFEVTKDIAVKLQAYAIDKGWIEPNEGIDCLPDNMIPTTKAELETLRKKVEAHV